MRDLSRPLEECLTAVKERRNLQEILRRYPKEREELIGMLRLSVELSSLGAPAADPAFRLRARNRMLGLAAKRRSEKRGTPLAWLPRPAARLTFAGMVAIGLVAAGITAAAASDTSLPGDPLYGVKLGIERVQLAVTLDSASRARLQLHLADVRLGEAQRLFSMGRKGDAITLVNEYEAAVAGFNQSVATASFDDTASSELSQLVQERQARADESLNALAGSLTAQGDTKTAAIISKTQSHVDQELRGSNSDLQAQQGSGRQNPRPGRPSPSPR
jgi:uncharacterized protein DUF5667